MDISLLKHPVVNQMLAKKNSLIFHDLPSLRDEVCTLLIQILPSLSRMRGYHLLDRSMHDYILGSSSLGTVCSPEPCSPIDLWRPLKPLRFFGHFWTLKWRYSTTCLAIFWGDSLKVSITGAMYGRYLQFFWCVEVRVSSINPHFA